MAKKRNTPELIVNKLHGAEILLYQEVTIAVINKEIGVNANNENTTGEKSMVARE